MKCGYCERKLNKGDNYIEYEGERFCDKCYDSYTFTNYSVGGEFLAADDDGVIEYSEYSLEEEWEML